MLFLKAHRSVLGPAFSLLVAALPEEISTRSVLAQAWRQLDHALNEFMDRQQIAP